MCAGLGGGGGGMLILKEQIVFAKKMSKAVYLLCLLGT